MPSEIKNKELELEKVFTRHRLALVVLIFIGVSMLIYKSLASTSPKTWTTQADFTAGTLSNVVAASDGTVKLQQTASSYSFTRSTIESGTQIMEGVAAGDVDGDGKDDAVLAGDSFLAWYKQPGWTKNTIATLSGPSRGFGSGSQTVVTDINNDGRNDVITGNEASVQELWFENTGSGWTQHIISNATKFHDIGFGDFNGDGGIEAIGVDQWGGAVAFLNPQADITQPWTYTTIESRNAMGLAIGDINGDGKLDFATGRGWYRNNGGNPATFTRFAFTNLTTSGVTYPGGWPASYFTDYSKLNFMDLNNDGKLDIFATIFAEGLEGHVYAFIQPADPTQTWTATEVDPGPLYAVHSQMAADYDGSGKPQFIIGESNQGGFSLPAKTGSPSIYLYKLTGSDPTNVSSWQINTIDTIGTHEAAVGDFDSDGKPDFTGHFENTTAAAAQFHWWSNGTTASNYTASGTMSLTYNAGSVEDWSGLSSLPSSNPPGTSITYQVRTSSDGFGWSSWGSINQALNSQYIQVLATLTTIDSTVTPTIDSLSLSFATPSSAPPDNTPPVQSPSYSTVDLNKDGQVNIFDLSILLSHYGRSGAGDLDGNGTVDIFDLSKLLSQYKG